MKHILPKIHNCRAGTVEERDLPANHEHIITQHPNTEDENMPVQLPPVLHRSESGGRPSNAHRPMEKTT